MTIFSGIDARVALTEFGFARADLHPGLVEIIAQPHWLTSIIEGSEYLYAKRADLTPDGLELLRDLAQFISTHNFYGKAIRCALMGGVAARILEGGAVEEEGDPEIDPAFLPAESPSIS